MKRAEPIHTFYCPAHTFEVGTLGQITEDARAFFAACFSSAADLGSTFELGPELAEKVYRRVNSHLKSRDLVEDLRVDFEDGYGAHSPEQEDDDARRVADLTAQLWQKKLLPAGFGIRVKAMGATQRARSERTLEIFLRSLLEGTNGVVPAGLVVTLAKIEHPREVRQLVDVLCRQERELGLEAGTFDLELMAETPASIFSEDGRLAVSELLAKADGRCIGVHLGVYDFTAAVGVVAGLQGLRNPICDFARQALLIGLAGTGVRLSDGSSRTVPPMPEDRATRDQARHGTRQIYDDVRHSLEGAIYQGWDLHPRQLVARLIAVYAFYHEQLNAMSERLQIAEQGATTAHGGLEDAATLEGLRTFFRRGQSCGAFSTADLPQGAKLPIR